MQPKLFDAIINLKKTLLFVTIFLSIGNFAIAIEPSNNTQGNKMLPSKSMTNTNFKAEEDFSEYTYTAQILREEFHKDEAYIRRFLEISKTASITLDPLFHGFKDSKPFTENQAGYSDAQKTAGISFLKTLVAQQFGKASPSDSPTYTTIPGAPGTGKTFVMQQRYNIDVAAGKFATNAITIGPDLVVMSQMDAYKKACSLPIGAERTKAMVDAYSIWRDMSNASANFMFMMALTENLNILHDSTMTSPTVAKLLDCVGKLGYTRSGSVLLAAKESRAGSLDERAKRNGGFALVTTADAVGKGVAGYERIADASYMGRFEHLSIYVQKPKFYLEDGTPVLVAEYNPKTGKINVLPEGQAHIDRIMQQAKDQEGLKPELLAAFEQAVNAWEKSPLVKVTPTP